VRQVWQGSHELFQIFLYRAQLLCGRRYSVAKLSHSLPARFGLLLVARLHHLADLLALAVASCVLVIPAADEFAAAVIKLIEAIDCLGRKAARFEFLANEIEVGANEIYVEHLFITFLTHTRKR
jgi:hypothetical protein